jgi:N-acetylneuraminic acid mutarotase
MLLLLFIFTTTVWANWYKVSDNGPWKQGGGTDQRIQPRRNFNMWCDEYSFHVFGGQTSRGRTNTFWTWQYPGYWVSNPSPSIQSRSGAASWQAKSRLWVFGGRQDMGPNVSLSDFWSYDGSTWSQVISNVPSSRFGSLVWTYQDNLYLYGGQNDNRQALDDMHMYDISSNTWTNINYTGISVPLDDGTAVVHGANVYVFGGYTNNGPDVGGLRVFNMDTLVWSIVIDNNNYAPPPREDHTMWLSRNKIYIYGGRVNGVTYSDTWVYDLATQSWAPTHNTFPPARWGASSCVTQNGRAYLFGGINQDVYNDLWYYDTSIGNIPYSQGVSDTTTGNTSVQPSNVAVAALVFGVINLFGLMLVPVIMRGYKVIRV